MEEYKIEILKHPTEEDWQLAKECTLITVGKNPKTPPSYEWKVRLLEAEHSPIRVLPFCFKITNLPYWVSVHLCRHVHATPFVTTERNDRQDKFDRNKAPQDSPVSMCWYMNAEELVTIAHKRLCHQASKETRELIEELCKLVIKTNPEFETVLVPKCYYRGGVCTEFKSCGYNKTYKAKENKDD